MQAVAIFCLGRIEEDDESCGWFVAGYKTCGFDDRGVDKGDVGGNVVDGNNDDGDVDDDDVAMLMAMLMTMKWRC